MKHNNYKVEYSITKWDSDTYLVLASRIFNTEEEAKAFKEQLGNELYILKKDGEIIETNVSSEIFEKIA